MLAALLLIFAALLVASGAEKLLRPLPAALAMHRAGLPAALPLARAVAVTELAAGTTALAFGGRAGASAVAVVYAAFTAFLLRAWSRGELGQPCGCFGDDSPLGPVHLVVDVAAVAVAATAVATGEPALGDVLSDDGLVVAASTVALVGAAAALLRGLLTTIPEIRLRGAP